MPRPVVPERRTGMIVRRTLALRASVLRQRRSVAQPAIVEIRPNS
jgi:hypothetical protein